MPFSPYRYIQESRAESEELRASLKTADRFRHLDQVASQIQNVFSDSSSIVVSGVKPAQSIKTLIEAREPSEGSRFLVWWTGRGTGGARSDDPINCLSACVSVCKKPFGALTDKG